MLRVAAHLSVKIISLIHQRPGGLASKQAKESTGLYEIYNRTVLLPAAFGTAAPAIASSVFPEHMQTALSRVESAGPGDRKLTEAGIFSK